MYPGIKDPKWMVYNNANMSFFINDLSLTPNFLILSWSAYNSSTDVNISLVLEFDMYLVCTILL